MLFLMENECEFLVSGSLPGFLLVIFRPGDTSHNLGKVIKMPKSIISWLKFYLWASEFEILRKYLLLKLKNTEKSLL